MLEKKIRIVVLTPSLECGGAERYVATICNNLDTKIFDITLLTINNTNPFFKINQNVKIVDLNKKSVKGALVSILKYARRSKPNIIFSTANHLNLLLAIFKFFIPKNIKIFARESSIVSQNTKHGKYPHIYNVMLKTFYKKLPIVICQSTSMQLDLIENYGFHYSQTIVINNGVVKVDKVLYSPTLPIPHFITIGRLEPEKRVGLIIEALSLLNNDFKYLIIGNGKEQKTLKQLVTSYNLDDKISFLPSINNPFEKISEVSFFLMASSYEGFPNVLLEANAYGIPIIAFKSVGGVAEIIRNGLNGIIVDSDKPIDFVDAIKHHLKIYYDSQAIKSHTEQFYSIKKMISQTENLFRSI